MVKVRFHLAKGENYMKWQVKDANGDVQYLEPEQVSIKMYGCKLINQRGTAEKEEDLVEVKVITIGI